MTFVCNKDYILEGTETTYCRADKSWNSPVPRCLGTFTQYLEGRIS